MDTYTMTVGHNSSTIEIRKNSGEIVASAVWLPLVEEWTVLDWGRDQSGKLAIMSHTFIGRGMS